MLGRYGTNNPDDKEIERMEKVSERLTPHINNKCDKGSERVKSLESYKFQFHKTDKKKLTKVGRDEYFSIGQRYRKHLDGFLKDFKYTVIVWLVNSQLFF